MRPLTQSTYLIIFIASFGQIGCSHIPERTNALSPDIRAKLGSIGVVSARYAPNSESRKPMDKGTGALSGAGASVLSLMGVVGSVGAGPSSGTGTSGLSGLGAPGHVGIFLIPLIPVAAVAGAIAGASKGVSPEEVGEAEASIKAAVRDLKMQDTLRDKFLEIAQKQISYPLVPIEAKGPISPGEKVSYRSLSGTGMDSILEISVTTCNLEGAGFRPDLGYSYINADLWVSTDVQVRLVRIMDDEEIYTHSFTTRCYGGRSKFLEWAANDAHLFKEEVTNCLSSVGEKIVSDVFKAFCDLTGQWMYLTGMCRKEGCEISGNFIIRNKGNLDASPSVVRFYLSEDAQYNQGKATLLMESAVKKIKGGEGKPIGLDYYFSTQREIRGKYVIAIIDAENKVAESDKENNHVFEIIK